MTTSPGGYPFEVIVFDIDQMTALDSSLGSAEEQVERMQLVLRNVADNLEGSGRALDKARSVAEEVAGTLQQPAARLRRLAREPLTTPGGYGSDDWWLW